MTFLASESARVLRGLAGFLEPAPKVAREYRIDDLAQTAGVSVRNVRVYQDRGLLPPPRKEGRTGWYNAAHLARLDLIGRMLDRGYTFATISELLTAAQYGMRVEDVLDPERADELGIGSDSTTTMTRDEFGSFFAGEVDIEPDLARAVANGLLIETGPDTYRVVGRRLPEAARLLVEAGVPMAEVLDQAGAVRSDLVDVAGRFVGLVRDRYLPDGDAVDLDPQTIGEAAELVTKAKAMVRDVVDALLTDALDEAIADALGDLARRLTDVGPRPDSL
ncbi:MerR family transcriptional regulator [Skermania piniformis]|uniref:MerR family transcriptional regulator n=2 Tax=Skermania pinensis TaxID=39122 RepID=A0ABX8SE83_9ACTN|nr:MerR family transcriptional regulator [Skermania piniformis]